MNGMKLTSDDLRKHLYYLVRFVPEYDRMNQKMYARRFKRTFDPPPYWSNEEIGSIISGADA